jgi:hypothetical protein
LKFQTETEKELAVLLVKGTADVLKLLTFPNGHHLGCIAIIAEDPNVKCDCGFMAAQVDAKQWVGKVDAFGKSRAGKKGAKHGPAD